MPNPSACRTALRMAGITPTRGASPTGLAPRLEILNPLYCGGLWLAVVITPPAQSTWLIAK